MIQFHRILSLSASALLSLALVACAKPSPAVTAHTVVVELFTSQGCSSCPPANDTLNKLAERPDVLALSFGVTYWDNLGWKDTFASPAFTQRQYDYANGLHHANVFTPQMVINGRKDTVGQKLSDVEPLIYAAKALPAGPSVILSADQVSIAASAQTAQVWLVRYDPRLVQVPVQRGENSGRTLPHRNVVRQLLKLGSYSGQAVSFTLPKSADISLKTAVLVQQGTGGPILSAAKD